MTRHCIRLCFPGLPTSFRFNMFQLLMPIILSAVTFTDLTKLRTEPQTTHEMFTALDLFPTAILNAKNAKI